MTLQRKGDGSHQVRTFRLLPRDSEGQGSLTCCSPWGHKELDMTERVNDDNIHMLCAGNYAMACPILLAVDILGELKLNLKLIYINLLILQMRRLKLGR